MSEKLPKKFPEMLTVDGKTYRYVSPDNARIYGMSSKLDTKWHYYVSDSVWQKKDEGSDPMGQRRHFTIFVGVAKKGGERKAASIHISLKSRPGKVIRVRGEGHFWFRYDEQTYEAAANWKFVEKHRAHKAEQLFMRFVQALTASDSPGTKTAVKVEPPPHHAQAVEVEPEGVATTPRVVPDSWEDSED